MDKNVFCYSQLAPLDHTEDYANKVTNGQPLDSSRREASQWKTKYVTRVLENEFGSQQLN